MLVEDLGVAMLPKDASALIFVRTYYGVENGLQTTKGSTYYSHTFGTNSMNLFVRSYEFVAVQPILLQ